MESNAEKMEEFIASFTKSLKRHPNFRRNSRAGLRELSTHLFLVVVGIREAYLVDCLILTIADVRLAVDLLSDMLRSKSEDSRNYCHEVIVLNVHNTVFAITQNCYRSRREQLSAGSWKMYPLWVNASRNLDQPTSCRSMFESQYTSVLDEYWQLQDSEAELLLNWEDISPTFVFGWILGFPCLYVLPANEMAAGNCLSMQELYVYSVECHNNNDNEQCFVVMQFSVPCCVYDDAHVSEDVTALDEALNHIISRVTSNALPFELQVRLRKEPVTIPHVIL